MWYQNLISAFYTINSDATSFGSVQNSTSGGVPTVEIATEITN
jgi:hypothetical protein